MYEDKIKKAVFTLHKRQTVIAGHSVARAMIVLRDRESGLIIRATDYADQAFYLREKLNIRAEDPDRLYAVCQLLNYILIERYEDYGITSISQMTLDMMEDFLADYSVRELDSGGFPVMRTIVAKRDAISAFALAMIKEGRLPYIKEADLVETVYVKVKGFLVEHRKYLLKVRAFKRPAGYKSLVRDMPVGIAKRFVMMTELYDPDITLAVVMGLYAGLREGEVCNLRMDSSTYGPCFRFTKKSKKRCTGIEIDLSRELPLRSDGVVVGRIKIERTQAVFPGYAQIIYDYYQKHIQRTKGYPREETMPLFVSTRKVDGRCMAMTKAAYVARIKRIFYDHVLPSCQNDVDPSLRLFYQQVQGHTWGLHSFRHWFTVSLILSGIDNVASLMNYRGDTWPDSSLVYIQNKGEIQRKYLEASEKFGRMIKGDG